MMNPEWSGHTLVEFHRPLERDHLVGFVLGWSKRLTLVQYVDDRVFDVDGYRVFRNQDVRRWREVDDASITARALRVKRIRAKSIPGLSVENWPAVLETANRRFPLLVIHREIVARGICQVGRAGVITKAGFELKEIDPDARWEATRRYRFADLTLVDFGGAYEDALARVAGVRVHSGATIPVGGALPRAPSNRRPGRIEDLNKGPYPLRNRA